MKKYLFTIIALALLTPLASRAQSARFITVKGKDIIGPDHKPFLIKGTNLGNWLVPEGYMFKFSKINSPSLINEAITELLGPDEARIFWQKYLDSYITRGDIHFLKASGMNTIRIPFNYKLFTGENYLGENNPNRGFELLDKAISWCKQEGLYVILDMHCAPGGQTGDNIDDGYGYPFLFQNEGSRKLTIKIWTRIAAHYKNETTVLGYDFLNEPIAHFFNKAELNPYLEPFYKELTKAVRTVDKNHIVILGGAQWDTNFDVFGPPFDAKIVYQFHKYGGDGADATSIQKFVEFRDKYNVPIYAGETGENNDAWILAFRKVLDAQHIGWTYWPYKKMDNLAGVMNFNRPMGYDSVIKYVEAPRGNFNDIRKAAPASREQIKTALYGFLENCRYQNCSPNKGYIEALGLSAK